MLSINSLMLRTATMPPLAKCRVDDFSRAGQGARVSRSGALGDVGAAALENDQRLIVLGGFTGDGQKRSGCLNPSTNTAITRVLASSMK